MLRRFTFVLIATFAVATAASAQTWPSKVVRMVTGSAAGGGADINGRPIAQRMSEIVKQQFVIDNRPGAAGLLANELVAKSAPDGYTLLMGSSELAVSASLIRNLPYDPQHDFTPVARVGETSYMLVVHPALAVKSVADLVALAKARPGQLNYASGGAGSPLNLAAELFKSMTATNLVAVQYKGGVPAITATLAGETQVVFGSVTTTLQFARSGRLRALAVTSARRSVLMPELPTIAESGVPGYELANWYGVLAPARISPALVTRLNTLLVKIMALPDLRERVLQNQGIEALTQTPEQFSAAFKSEVEKWRRLVQETGLRVE